MKRKHTAIPQFKSLEEESDFWATHCLTEFETRPVSLAEIQRATRSRVKKATLTVELPQQDVARLKRVATARGINYKHLAAELLHKQLAKT